MAMLLLVTSIISARCQLWLERTWNMARLVSCMLPEDSDIQRVANVFVPPPNVAVEPRTLNWLNFVSDVSMEEAECYQKCCQKINLSKLHLGTHPAEKSYPQLLAQICMRLSDHFGNASSELAASSTGCLGIDHSMMFSGSALSSPSPRSLHAPSPRSLRALTSPPMIFPTKIFSLRYRLCALLYERSNLYASC